MYAKGAILRLARRGSTIGLADGQRCDDFRSINVKLSEYLKPFLKMIKIYEPLLKRLAS